MRRKGLHLTASAVGAAADGMELAGEGDEPEPSYDKVRERAIEARQQAEDTVAKQRRQVLGDDGLRSAVAGEIEDGDLLVDRNALVGAGRKAFTRFVYGRMTGLRIVRSPRPRFTG